MNGESLIPSLAALVLYGAVVYAAALVVAYRFSSSKVFGSAGHTSSEFKLEIFKQVNFTVILLACLLHGATAPWLPIAVVAAMALSGWNYARGRSDVKATSPKK